MRRKAARITNPETIRHEFRYHLLEARAANRRAWKYLAKWGRNSASALLYADHERSERDRHMKAARKWLPQMVAARMARAA